MSSYEDFDSDGMQSQAATSSYEDSDPDSDSDEIEVPRLTADEKRATTEGKDPKPFTALIKYPTLLTKPIPILDNPVYVCQPDWDQKCDIVHKWLVSINALQGSCNNLRSTLDDRLRFFDSFTASSIEKTTPKNTMTTTIAKSMRDVLAKVTDSSNKLLDMESHLRWKKVHVVDSLCSFCDQKYREDWTELHGDWDHPPYFEKHCFGNGWLRKEQSMLEGLNLN
ncbi:MAG: hypothetical protein L6R38_003355 [Xanthoria sp. 2 TBL-2021]|nr:MAG: hypothetical protein L6R38_003355 [Xanthoria sp. 2 TBL-2021]